jgi:succinate dehydrogenase / fumarate reductase flavoprotein subunit
MEVGPTCHYVMGGVEVDADSAAAVVPGLFAAGEVAGGMHGSNRLGGNSLSDLLVFGRRAGLGAAEYVDALAAERPAVSDEAVTAATAEAMAPFERESGENPYALHNELQQTMNDLVGIIRKEDELVQALTALEKLRTRVAEVSVEAAASAGTGRAYHPGWHLALDLRNMLLVSECIAKSALERQESRGGHTRDDYPAMSAEWRQVNLICRLASDDNGVELTRQPAEPMRDDLIGLFEIDELQKYLTEAELPSGARTEEGQ